MLKVKKDIEEQSRVLHKVHVAERRTLNTIRSYWKGQQDLPAVIPTSAPDEVRVMAHIARVNVCDIVVDSLAQSLFVDGFRIGNSSEDVAPWEAWQKSRFDREQSGVHRAASAYGTSYTVVTRGTPTPVIRGVSPRMMTTLYGEDPDWPVWALEKTSAETWRLYDDEAIYFLSRKNHGPFEYIETRQHGMPECPVVRYRDAVDLDEGDDLLGVKLGQVGPLIPLQDQIDLTTFGLLVAQHYSAFRQRYILGWVADSEEQRVKAAASQLWTFKDHPDDMKIGELAETSLEGYIKSREASLKYAATLSQTPVHELIGEMINMSADALAAAEAGKDRKVDERKTGYGESHEQTLWLAGSQMGVEVPPDAEVVWRDTSARAFAAVIDGLGKLVQMLGIPPEELWEKVPGATQQDVKRWKAAAAQGDSMAMLRDLFDAQAAPLEPQPVEAA